jgi:hypothetical protein
MSWMSKRSWTDDVHDDVAHHLSALRREIASLGRGAGRYARSEASELGDALLHSGAAAARQIGRQAKVAGRAIRREPASAVAGVIAVACLASLLMGGSKSRR